MYVIDHMGEMIMLDKLGRYRHKDTKKAWKKHLAVSPEIHIFVVNYAREHDMTIEDAVAKLLGLAFSQEYGIDKE